MANLDVALLPNHWYAIAASTDLGSTPIAASLLDQQLVVYRTTAGQVVVLDDRCPHRGASLACGQVKGNAIACPYHGWQFDLDGHCAQIPSQQASANSPSGKSGELSCPGALWLDLGVHRRSRSGGTNAVVGTAGI